MPDFIARFPRTVAAQDYRLPLDHPALESIAGRMDRLYKTAPLTHSERIELLKLFRSMRSADRFFSRLRGNRPLPATHIRPQFLDDAHRVSSEFFGQSDVRVRAGFVWRVADYVAELERKHFGVGVGADDI